MGRFVTTVICGAFVRREMRARLDYVKAKFNKVIINYIEHKGWLDSDFVIVIEGSDSDISTVKEYLRCE